MKDASTLSCQFSVRVLYSLVGAYVFLGLLSPAIAFAHEGHNHNADAEREQVLLQMGLDAQGNPLPTSPTTPQSTIPQPSDVAPVAVPKQSSVSPPKAGSAWVAPIVAPSIAPTANPIAPVPAVKPTPADATPQAIAVPPGSAPVQTQLKAVKEQATLKAVGGQVKLKAVERQADRLATPPLTSKNQLLAQATTPCATIDTSTPYAIQSRSSGQVLDVFGGSQNQREKSFNGHGVMDPIRSGASRVLTVATIASPPSTAVKCWMSLERRSKMAH